MLSKQYNKLRETADITVTPRFPPGPHARDNIPKFIILKFYG